MNLNDVLAWKTKRLQEEEPAELLIVTAEESQALRLEAAMMPLDRLRQICDPMKLTNDKMELYGVTISTERLERLQGL